MELACVWTWHELCEGRIKHEMTDVWPVDSTMLCSRVSTIMQYMATVLCHLLVGLGMNVEGLSGPFSALSRTLSVIGIVLRMMSVTYVLHYHRQLTTIGHEHSPPVYPANRALWAS